MKTRVLIVEDEAALMTLLRYNLEREGFGVVEAGDGEAALAAAAAYEPELILLDWMLPVMSGLEVCRQLRRKTAFRETPIIMLTARGEEAERVRGLDVGADDYITKPFSLPELLARIRALLRRTQPAQAKGVLTFGDITMDLSSHRVVRGDRQVHLGPTEFRILKFLMQRPRCVFSREELLKAAWPPEIFVEPRTVDVHIRRLRKALNVGEVADLIRTVRAAGYALDEETAEA